MIESGYSLVSIIGQLLETIILPINDGLVVDRECHHAPVLARARCCIGWGVAKVDSSAGAVQSVPEREASA